MFERIKSWLLDVPDRTGGRRYEEYEIAAAALLVEAATLDVHFDPVERTTILGLLARRFNLSPEQARVLLAVGEARQRDSNEVFKFALAARQAFTEEERVDLVEMLWVTILSDGEVHEYESSLMRRMVGLLHVPDVAAGEARKRAAQRLANGGQGDKA
jgi:uncharacterized tellurite resistance protein B-like protein